MRLLICKAKYDYIKRIILCVAICDSNCTNYILWNSSRGELSYLVPLGSENISAPYFKQCFFREGGYYPPD